MVHVVKSQADADALFGKGSWAARQYGEVTNPKPFTGEVYGLAAMTSEERDQWSRFVEEIIEDEK